MLALRGRRGFTLIEILLSVALIGILAGLSLSLIRSSQTRNDLTIARNSFVEGARNARARAMLGSVDDDWGVIVDAGEVTVFKGSTYATRDPDYDSVSEIASTISHSGLNEVSFGKITGQASSVGSVTLTNATGESENIAINAEGTVSY